MSQRNLRPPGIEGKLSSAYGYFDRVHLWLKHPATRHQLHELSEHCGHLYWKNGRRALADNTGSDLSYDSRTQKRYYGWPKRMMMLLSTSSNSLSISSSKILSMPMMHATISLYI